jgi:hypothetical protein
VAVPALKMIHVKDVQKVQQQVIRQFAFRLVKKTDRNGEITERRCGKMLMNRGRVRI